MRLDDLDRELRRYRRFFRRAAGVAIPRSGGTPEPPRIVLAPFDVTVNRFGDVIDAVNARFATRFNRFDHTDPAAKAAVFEEMEREARSTPAELDRMWRIARPNTERAEATREMKARLTGPTHRRALARCEAIYEQLLGAALF
jgi:hypothetical protein